MTLLANWQIAHFATTPFIQWWSEWQEHIFCKSANLYCMALDNNYQSGENEVQVKFPPTIFLNISHLQPLTSTLHRMMIRILLQSVGVGSWSTTPCQSISQISAMVPQLWQMWQATGRKRKVSYTKVTTHKKKKSPGQSSAAVSQTDALVDLLSSSEGKSLNFYDFTLSERWSYFCFTIKILLNTNLKEKKIFRTHLLLHHPSFRCNPAYSASI